MSTYDFDIATQFPTGKLDSGRFAQDIRGSSIPTALDRIDTSGGTCSVVFKAALDAPNEAVLNALVATHSGLPLAQPTQVVNVEGPKEVDGKAIVVISPATEGMKTWLTSRGDDLTQGAAGRAKGAKLAVTFDGTEAFPCTKNIDIPFSEPVEVHDGQFNWTPGTFDQDDFFSVSVIMPPSAPTSTPGTGNVNEYPIGGGAVLYVPAAGDGSHTIDLSDYSKAVPIPASGGGFWDVSDDGVITPSATPGQASWHLANFPVEPFLIADVSMFNSIGLFDVDVYKTEWIHQAWKIRLSVTKTTPGAGIAAGWLLCFRQKVTRT